MQSDLKPDMSSQQLRMHLGEMTAQEERTARAAMQLIWNTRALQQISASEIEATASKYYIGDYPECEIRTDMFKKGFRAACERFGITVTEA